MNRAVVDMLLQTGEDAPFGGNTTVVLLPSWPCDTDVDFTLWAPQATAVSVVYAGGKLQSLGVTPPWRAAAVRFGGCVPAGDAAAAVAAAMAAAAAPAAAAAAAAA
jgi:hypothetical protein